MGTGLKAQGHEGRGKWVVRRHGGGGGKGRRCRKAAGRSERALERRVRRQGRAECAAGADEYKRSR